MKVSCTHFQCSAGAFSYLRDHFSHSFSVDMSHQILSLNINLMLVGSSCAAEQVFPWKREAKRSPLPRPQGQAQECLLEKSMLDNRKSFLVARISAQVLWLLWRRWARRPAAGLETVGVAAGGGLLQGGLQSSGELGDGVHAGEDPERLEETGPDEDLLLCRYRSRESFGVCVCVCRCV